MSVIGKLLTVSILVLVSFLMVSPPTAYGYSSGSVDHTNHAEGMTATTVDLLTDCASACARIARTGHSDLVAKETRQKTQSQPQSKSETINPIREKTQPDGQITPKTNIFSVVEIYKITCALLF